MKYSIFMQCFLKFSNPTASILNSFMNLNYISLKHCIFPLFQSVSACFSTQFYCIQSKKGNKNMLFIKFPLCHFGHMSSSLQRNLIYIRNARKIFPFFARKFRGPRFISLHFDHSSRSGKLSSDKFPARIFLQKRQTVQRAIPAAEISPSIVLCAIVYAVDIYEINGSIMQISSQ